MPPSTARFVDAILNERGEGGLETLIRSIRGEGLGWGAVAYRINALLPEDCAVDGATYQRYAREYGIEST